MCSFQVCSLIIKAFAKERIAFEFQVLRQIVWRNSVVTVLIGAVFGGVWARGAELTIKEGAFIGAVTTTYSLAVGILLYINPLIGITSVLLTAITYLTGYYYGSDKIRKIVLCSCACFLGTIPAFTATIYDSNA